MVFALSPALGWILLMVSVRATFHYQSSIMWRPPAGPPGRHLCQVRSTTRPVCGQAEQIMPSYGLLGHNYRARRTGGSGYDVIEEIEADCGFCRAEEGVTGRGSGWTPRKQLPLTPPASAAPAVVTPACTWSASIFKHVLSWKSSVKSLFFCARKTSISSSILQAVLLSLHWKMEGDERSPAAQRGTRSRRHAVHGAASRALSSAYRQGNFHLHTGREDKK